MRISDWSSDVCSSDLLQIAKHLRAQLLIGVNQNFAQFDVGYQTLGFLGFLLSAPARQQHASELVGMVASLHTVSCQREEKGFETLIEWELRRARAPEIRSEENTSELQSRMRILYAVFCLKKKNNIYKL